MARLFRSFRSIRVLSVQILVFAGSGVTARQAAPEQLIRRDLGGNRGGNLIVAISADPSTFNRMLTSSLPNSIVADRLSADLVHINRRTMELEPSLASRWEMDPDAKSYTLHLRRGIRFSDGAPFTADDVLFSFQVLQDPNVAADQAGQLLVDGAFPAITRLDNYTVRVTFPRPVGMGLRALDSIPMLPKHRLEDAYRQGILRSAWGPTAPPETVVGLGPFRLKEYQRGVRVVVERNPFFWKKDRSDQMLPYLDSLTFLIIQDRNAEALRFQAGELDLAISLNPENYATLKRNLDPVKYQLADLGPGLGMDFLWFNMNPGSKPSGDPYVDPEKLRLFQKSEFRRAVSMALDRRGMSQSILLGLGAPQSGPISSGNKIWLNPNLPREDNNPAAARKLFAEAGLQDRNGDGVLEFGSRQRPLEITLLTSRGNMTREKIVQVIAQNLSDAGLRVNTQLLLTNEIAARFLETFEYEAILFGITPTDVVPDLQTDLWYSSGRLHLWNPGQKRPQHAWEAELDRLTSRLVQTVNAAARKEVFDRMQALWAQEMPAIPTIAPHLLMGWKSSVVNVAPSVMVPYLLWNAEELAFRE